MRARAGLSVVLLAAAALSAGCYDFSQLTAPEASKCGNTPMLFCDGFESASAYAGNWHENTTTDNGTVSIDGSRAYRGAHSLHLQTPAVSPSTVAAATTVHYQPVLTSLQRHVRGFFFLPPVKGPSGILFALLQQSVPQFDAVGIGLGPDGKIFFHDRTSAVSMATPTGVDLPTNMWVCLELTLTTTGSGVTLSVAIADHPDPKLSHDRASPPTPFAELGITSTARDDTASLPAYEWWADEIAISDGLIGCAK